MSATPFRLEVVVQPRAKRTEVVGWQGKALKVRVAAPPVDGAANLAVVELLATALGVPRSRVRLVRGESGRQKLVEVDAPAATCLEQLEKAGFTPK